MEPERRQRFALAALVVLLAFAAWYWLWPSTDSASSAASGAARAGIAVRGQQAVSAPDVHVAALTAARPTPDDVGRNLFQFKAKPVAAAPPRPVAPPAPIVRPLPGPPIPPAIPPIPLKYIGYIQTASGEKIASFTDASSLSPVQAKEGQTVLGRYKLLRIGVESADLSYVDGTGRQTIRQTGQ